MTDKNNIIMCISVAREQLGKHVPNNAHPTIERRILLGNRPVNIYHSNECATIELPLLRDAWVDTPDNNEQLMCFLWVVRAEPIQEAVRLFERIREEVVVEGSSVVDVLTLQVLQLLCAIDTAIVKA
jgi:hypothetical protein